MRDHAAEAVADGLLGLGDDAVDELGARGQVVDEPHNLPGCPDPAVGVARRLREN